MNIFLDPASPSSFDVFFTMLAAEHFIPTIIVSVLLMVCCGYYLHKFADDQPQWRSVVAFLVMLVLMLMLFTLVEVRCEYNEAKSLAAETEMQ